MTDRYQPLRDAIAGPIIRSPRIAVRAAGSICVGDTRPVDTVEDLERGLHIEILGGENTEAEAQFIAAADPDTIAALLKERDTLREALIEAKTRIAAIGYPASPDGEYSKDGEWTFSDAVPRAVDAGEVKAAFLVLRAALADGETK